jgi:hypothetical protein
MNLIKPRGGRDGTVTERERKKLSTALVASATVWSGLACARANNQKQSFIFTNYRTTFAEHLLHHSCYYSCGFLIRIMCVIHIPPRLQLPVKGGGGRRRESSQRRQLFLPNLHELFEPFFYCDGFYFHFPSLGLFSQ